MAPVYRPWHGGSRILDTCCGGSRQLAVPPEGCDGGFVDCLLLVLPLTARLRMVATADAKRHAAQSRAAAQGGLSRRPLRLELQYALAIAGGHDPLGPVHRHAGEHRHQGPVQEISRRPRPMPRPSCRARAGHPEHRLLSQQGQEHQACCEELVDEHDGQVPQDLDAWSSCPASAARRPTWCWARPLASPTGVVVDTHVGRLSKRLGLTNHKDPVKIERDLMAVLPKREWIDFSPPHDRSRPAGLHGPQAEVRRLPAGRRVSRESASPTDRELYFAVRHDIAIATAT